MHFGCLACGRCCHGLRLTLTISEAIRWIERGGSVEILCDGLPIAGQTEGGSRRDRIFAARSGSLEISVDLMLVATFAAACPNLLADMRCGIYDERPMVCRVYPADLAPGRIIDPASRRCPPEAWDAAYPLIAADDGTIVDPETARSIERVKDGLAEDASVKCSLAAILGVEVAALHNEGFAVWEVPQGALLDALRAASHRHVEAVADDREWHFSSNRAATRDLIAQSGAALAPAGRHPNLSYLPFFEDA